MVSRDRIPRRPDSRQSPPPLPENGHRHLMIGIIIMILLFTFIPILWLYDPVRTEWMPKCMIKLLTGWQCPGCGITRAIHAALHGRFAEALSYNLFFIISIPYLVGVGMVSYIPGLRKRRRLHRLMLGSPLGVTYIVLFSIWFVVRNLLGI